MADAVRLFVITWDPLAGMVQRPSGFATTNGARGRSRDRDLPSHLVIGAYGHRPQQHARGRHGGTGRVGHRDGVPPREHGECRPLPRPGRQGRGTGSPVRSGGWQCARRGGHHGAARQGGEPSGSRWASVLSPISSNTPSARSTSTGHRWSSPRSPRPTRVARRARAAGSASPANWPKPGHDVPGPPPPGRVGHQQAPRQGECEQPGRVGGDQHRVAGDRPATPAQRAGRPAAPAPPPRSTSSQDPMSSPSAPPPSSRRPGGFAIGPTNSRWLSGRNPSWLASGPNGWRTSSSISARQAWDPQRSGSVTRLARSTPVGRHPSTPTWPSPSPSPASPTKARRPNRGQPGPLAARPLGPHARRRRPRRAGRSRGSKGAFRGRAADGRGERRLRSHGRGDSPARKGHPAVRRRAQRTRRPARATQAQAQQGTAPTPRSPQASVACESVGHRRACRGLRVRGNRIRTGSVQGAGHGVEDVGGHADDVALLQPDMQSVLTRPAPRPRRGAAREPGVGRRRRAAQPVRDALLDASGLCRRSLGVGGCGPALPLWLTCKSPHGLEPPPHGSTRSWSPTAPRHNHPR